MFVVPPERECIVQWQAERQVRDCLHPKISDHAQSKLYKTMKERMWPPQDNVVQLRFASSVDINPRAYWAVSVTIVWNEEHDLQLFNVSDYFPQPIESLDDLEVEVFQELLDIPPRTDRYEKFVPRRSHVRSS